MNVGCIDIDELDTKDYKLLKLGRERLIDLHAHDSDSGIESEDPDNTKENKEEKKKERLEAQCTYVRIHSHED